jgi:hypothetical protein
MNNTIEEKNQQILNNQGVVGKFPEYKENYGHQFERKLAVALKEGLPEIVEETEMATSEEDKNKKQRTDIWVKFWGIDDPIAVQVTFSSNKEKMKEKKEDVQKNPLVRKDKRPDALFQPVGNRLCNKVLVSFDMQRVKTEIIGARMLADTLRQIMAGLPSQSKAIFIKTVGERMKKAGKKLPA